MLQQVKGRARLVSLGWLTNPGRPSKASSPKAAEQVSFWVRRLELRAIQGETGRVLIWTLIILGGVGRVSLV